jgi:predicted porin
VNARFATFAQSAFLIGGTILCNSFCASSLPCAAAFSIRRKSQDYLIGAQVPFNKHTFIASYIYKDGDDTMTGNANQVALGYTYTMSKRTNLYAAWGRINNGTNSLLTVGNNSEPGYGDKALNLGIRHIF